jgi:hypothetical protein
MRPQIQFFEAAIDAFIAYGALLRAGAVALQKMGFSPDLVVSLMRDDQGVLPNDIVARLLGGADHVDKVPVNIRNALSQPDIAGAQQLIRSHAKSLDRILESVLDMQSPPDARIPPPYRYFSPIITKMDQVFPFELDDPIETPQVLAFQHHLETVENPWRQR